MTDSELYAELQKRGARLSVGTDGRLLVGPAPAIRDLAPAIAAHRDVLLFVAAYDAALVAEDRGDLAECERLASVAYRVGSLIRPTEAG
ncbi:MAG: hypothetical protein JW850_15800 [Thermoflexales bacterium]|nr:hypothetical protein [Thermoflexales bacterium]